MAMAGILRGSAGKHVTDKIILDQMAAKVKAVQDALEAAKKFADQNDLTFNLDLTDIQTNTYYGRMSGWHSSKC